MSPNEPRTRGRTSADRPSIPLEGHRAIEVLDLLGDEYAREVLRAVIDRPRSATEVAEATTVSKSTAFRRLDRLESAGLVEARPAIDVDRGNHHRRFEPVFEAITIEVEAPGLDPEAPGLEVAVSTGDREVESARPLSSAGTGDD